MDRVYLTGIYVLHPLFGINMSADTSFTLCQISRDYILVRFQSLAEFHIPVATDVILEDPRWYCNLQRSSLTELSRPFSRIRGEGRAILFPLVPFCKTRNILVYLFNKKKIF